ncbi:class I SAM-dependent methyltransferase [Caenimonas sp. SL110]|uniref:class I SAM-dependent methyltransferase n=1 Tax=Caenimonas sp. SL110 TaxID=1450524 RepID=UPI00069E8991|nr:class I SAM-dependent methyltransferase [Caenimonas sp. SL110]
MRLQISNVELRLADMTQLGDFHDGSFNAVVSSMALHHLPDLESLDQTFLEVNRILRPGGAIYLSDFGRLKSAESVDYFASRAADGEEQALIDDYVQSLHAAFSRKEFEAAAKRHLSKLARVYSTIGTPLGVVIRVGDSRIPTLVRNELNKVFSKLPAARKSDVSQLKLFFLPGGLRSAL